MNFYPQLELTQLSYNELIELFLAIKKELDRRIDDVPINIQERPYEL